MRDLRCTASSLVLRDTPGGNDTRRRILQGQIVKAHGESYDRAWIWVVAPSGSGWAAAKYLELVTPAPTVVGKLYEPRAAWGAQHGDGGNKLPAPAEIVVAHHAKTPDVPPDATVDQERSAIRAIERHHVETNHWKAIAYGFLICPSGRAYEGRGFRMIGAHADGVNSKSLGICFVIDGDAHQLTAAAITTFRALVSEGVRRGAVAKGFRLKGHRDVNADTRCPGEKVYAQLGALA